MMQDAKPNLEVPLKQYGGERTSLYKVKGA